MFKNKDLLYFAQLQHCMFHPIVYSEGKNTYSVNNKSVAFEQPRKNMMFSVHKATTTLTCLLIVMKM